MYLAMSYGGRRGIRRLRRLQTPSSLLQLCTVVRHQALSNFLLIPGFVSGEGEYEYMGTSAGSTTFLTAGSTTAAVETVVWQEWDVAGSPRPETEIILGRRVSGLASQAV